jgi:hypothetical protein
VASARIQWHRVLLALCLLTLAGTFIVSHYWSLGESALWPLTLGWLLLASATVIGCMRWRETLRVDKVLTLLSGAATLLSGAPLVLYWYLLLSPGAGARW